MRRHCPAVFLLLSLLLRRLISVRHRSWCPGEPTCPPSPVLAAIGAGPGIDEHWKKGQDLFRIAISRDASR